MRTLMRLFSVVVNLVMASTAIVLTPLVVARRGLVWEAWVLALGAISGTIALTLAVIAAIEEKEGGDDT